MPNVLCRRIIDAFITYLVISHPRLKSTSAFSEIADRSPLAFILPLKGLAAS